MLIEGVGVEVGWYHSRAVVYEEEKSLTPTGIRNSDRPALNLVTVPTTLPNLSIIKRTFAYACVIYRVIPSVLDPRKCEYLKDYSLFNLIFCKCILYL
jgi:hypothetical protein